MSEQDNNEDAIGFLRRVVSSGEESKAMAVSLMREQGLSDTQIQSELAKYPDDDGDGGSQEDPELTAWLQANHDKNLS